MISENETPDTVTCEQSNCQENKNSNQSIPTNGLSDFKFQNQKSTTKSKKRTILFFLAGIVAIIFLISILDPPSPEEELIDYVENEMPSIFLMDKELGQSYNESLGMNIFNSKAITKELKRNTIPGCKKILKSAKDIHIKNEELKEIHSKYINCLEEEIDVLESLSDIFDVPFYRKPDYLTALGQIEKLAESRCGVVSESGRIGLRPSHVPSGRVLPAGRFGQSGPVHRLPMV